MLDSLANVTGFAFSVPFGVLHIHRVSSGVCATNVTWLGLGSGWIRTFKMSPGIFGFERSMLHRKMCIFTTYKTAKHSLTFHSMILRYPEEFTLIYKDLRGVSKQKYITCDTYMTWKSWFTVCRLLRTKKVLPRSTCALLWSS